MSNERVKNFGLSFDREFRDEFIAGCERIFDEAYLTDATEVRAFEEACTRFLGAGEAIAVHSGTAALEAVLLAIDVRGKEVLVPTTTFIATATAVERAGGIVVPIDIEPRAFALDPAALSAKLHAGVGAVIVVHIGGIVSPRMRELADLCARFKVPLVEDCAHAHGSSHAGTPAGAFGIAGCFSFFPTKVATSGEGGVIVTRDPAFAETLRSVRRFGREPVNTISHVRAGSNFKMTEFQGLLGRLDLRRAPARIERRRAIADRYRLGLAGSAWETVAPPEGGVSSYYKQIVLAPVSWQTAHAALERKGIEPGGGVYFIPLHRQPFYRERCAGAAFPIADRFADHHVCPPIYPELTFEEVDRVCAALKEIA